MNLCNEAMNVLNLGWCLGVLFGTCCLGLVPAFAQENWHLEKDKEQIKVYSRKLPGRQLTELKVECTMPGTQSQLLALLTDFPNYKNVVYKTKSARLLKRVSETELIYYVVTALPWPISDRDMAVRLTFNYEPDGKLLHIRGANVPNLVTGRPNMVRIADWLADWQVRQVTKNQMHITYVCRVDPGGDIPAWLDNVAAASSAYQSFSLLRESIALPRYQDKTFAFLTQ